MTVLKWTMESVIAAVAVVGTTAGGIYSTSYHWGQVNTQVEDLKSRAAAVESHVTKHDDQLSEIKQQNAGIAQSIDDIKDTVHDIQNTVGSKNGNNR